MGCPSPDWRSRGWHAGSSAASPSYGLVVERLLLSISSARCSRSIAAQSFCWTLSWADRWIEASEDALTGVWRCRYYRVCRSMHSNEIERP
jgi:hypothetical protein